MTILFLTSWVILFIMALRLMSKGWQASTQLGSRKYVDEGKRYVTRPVHPEMADLKPGDELLVVNFNEEPKEMDPRFKLDSPELHNLDPLQKSLRDRINELKDDENDDDDDGNVPAVTRR